MKKSIFINEKIQIIISYIILIILISIISGIFLVAINKAIGYSRLYQAEIGSQIEFIKNNKSE